MKDSYSKMFQEVCEMLSKVFPKVGAPFFSRFDRVVIEGAFQPAGKDFFKYDDKAKILTLKNWHELEKFKVPNADFKRFLIRSVLSQIFHCHPASKTEANRLMSYMMWRGCGGNKNGEKYPFFTADNIEKYLDNERFSHSRFTKYVETFDLNRLSEGIGEFNTTLKHLMTVEKNELEDEIDIDGDDDIVFK